MRNQLFLTLAANRAYVLGCNTLITGVGQEDFGGYPDCRQVFIDSFIQTSSFGTFTGTQGELETLRVLTPLMDLSKKQTIKLALNIERCYEALALTHTAYDGAYPPTGSDHATLLRAKGFEEAGIPDPLILRAHYEGLLPDLPETENYSPDAISPWMAEAVGKLVSWVVTWRRAYV
jgi:7-cyano-7-deazaguanine synthase